MTNPTTNQPQRPEPDDQFDPGIPPTATTPYQIFSFKTWPTYFEAIIDGGKLFEVREYNPDVKVGDRFVLYEFVPVEQDRSGKWLGSFTGRQLAVAVTYILPGGQFGIQQGYAVYGIKLV